MAAVDHTKTTRSTRKPTRVAHSPDFPTLLGRFSTARAVIETACRSLETGERHTEETTALRVGLTMLDAAYNEFDFAIDAIDSKSGPRRPLIPVDAGKGVPQATSR